MLYYPQSPKSTLDELAIGGLSEGLCAPINISTSDFGVLRTYLCPRVSSGRFRLHLDVKGLVPFEASWETEAQKRMTLRYCPVHYRWNCHRLNTYSQKAKAKKQEVKSGKRREKSLLSSVSQGDHCLQATTVGKEADKVPKSRQSGGRFFLTDPQGPTKSPQEPLHSALTLNKNLNLGLMISQFDMRLACRVQRVDFCFVTFCLASNLK